MYRFRILGICLLIVFAVGMAGCDDSDSSRRAGEAFLRVLHDSCDAPAVDVLLDDEVAIADLGYPDVGPDEFYVGVASGSTNVKVNVAGTDTTVIEADLQLAADTDYTIIATDFVEFIDALVLVDDNSPPVAGNVKVRVVHGAPSAPDVDVYVTAPGVDINDLEPVLSDVPFTAVSAYLEIPEGEYAITVTLAGTKDVAIGPVEVALVDGQIRTVVAREDEGCGSPFSLKFLVDAN
jgi:hypothetical protein